jgi:hypothetical protein
VLLEKDIGFAKDGAMLLKTIWLPAVAKYQA